jgi:hypothetical protein
MMVLADLANQVDRTVRRGIGEAVQYRRDVDRRPMKAVYGRPKEKFDQSGAGRRQRRPSSTKSNDSAGWHFDHGRHGQFPGEPPSEQTAADAMVTPGRRPAAGSLRCLQRRVGSTFGQKFHPANDTSPLTAKAA